jgi:shikimate kinase
MNNVILIGMPGVGKSTVGVVLAKKLGFYFTDSDLVIQQKTGKLLYQLIEERGEAGFLALENEVNASLRRKRHVIATGGSAVYGKQAMRHLKKLGPVIYLKLPYEELAERLGDLRQRGVVLPEGFTLRDLYEERCPLYEKHADIIIDCSGKRIREVVDEIVKHPDLQEKEGSRT